VSDDARANAFAALQGELHAVRAQDVDPCAIYRDAKPLIDGVLPFIKLLPDGPLIVETIQFLEKLADSACSIKPGG
jgi:hypothetical protein